MKPTIQELMSALGCTKWPERWAEIYDDVMEQYEKCGCEFTNPDIYDKFKDKYNVLEKYGEYYKTAAAEIAKDDYLSRLLTLLCTVAKDRTHAKEEFLQFSPPVAPNDKRELKYDMLTALVMCSTYDYTYSLLTARKIPQNHIDYILNIPDIMISSFKEYHNGAVGAMSWTWYQRTSVEALLYRTGRLEIEINTKFSERGVVFENTKNKGEIVTLANIGRFHRDGQLLGSKNFIDQEGAFDVSIKETDDAWIGHPFDERGHAKKEITTLKKTEWKKLIEPGDPVISLHIPSGGGLTPEKVDAAFAEAKAFLATYYPNINYKAFVCNSWLMDRNLINLLGDDANLSKFIKRFTPLCIKSAGMDALKYIFLQSDPYTAVIKDLPENSSLQRTLKKLYLDGNCIYEMFGFIPKDKI